MRIKHLINEEMTRAELRKADGDERMGKLFEPDEPKAQEFKVGFKKCLKAAPNLGDDVGSCTTAKVFNGMTSSQVMSKIFANKTVYAELAKLLASLKNKTFAGLKAAKDAITSIKDDLFHAVLEPIPVTESMNESDAEYKIVLKDEFKEIFENVSKMETIKLKELLK